MNKVILMGRLTRSPEVRYSQGAEPVAVARYTLAVNRRFKRKDEPGCTAKKDAGGEADFAKQSAERADFIPCVAFGKSARICGEIFPEGAAGYCDGTFTGAELGGQRREETLDNRGNC